MQTYRVPQNLNDEEKVIGGVASLRQSAYLLAGVVVGLFLVYLIPGSMTTKVIVFSLPVVLALAVGFARYREINLDAFFVLYLKYARGRKQFRYERRERRW